MGREKIVEAIKKDRVLCADGAWGTLLFQKGLQLGECLVSWCLDRPEDVMSIAKSYINAGADIIQTNSFGGNDISLSDFGLEDEAWAINEAAARISRKAAGEKGWVMASVGPVGKLCSDELYEVFKKQILALEKGGADAICIETMISIREAVIAVKAAKEHTDLEIICTFTFSSDKEGNFVTLAGESLKTACTSVIEAGADIVGANCCSDIKDLVAIVKEINTVLPDTPIIMQANAGLPKLNEDGIAVYPETPETMASITAQLIEAGARIIGGCCGTTPAHIKAIKEVIVNRDES